MKKVVITLASFLVFIILFSSCRDKIVETYTYTANVPVYMSYETLRSSVNTTSPQSFENPGKIYFKDDYIFVVEYFEGVHIINNSTPSAPSFVSFIEIPGTVDIAVKNNYLYADSYIDLVVIDISDPSNATEVNRLENVFPYSAPAFDYSYPTSMIEEMKGVIVGWEIKEITESNEYINSGNKFYYYDYDVAYAEMDASGSQGGRVSPNSSGSTVGVAGSMARFIARNDHLYTIDNQEMHIFDISNAEAPSESGSLSIGWNIETLFPYNEYLFIGSQTGMFVYSTLSPGSPTFLTEFSHINSCDPVVFDGNYAYVTLRGGNECGGFANQLDVIDVSNMSNALLVKSYEMTEPYGLGVSDSLLFICDGSDGLKVYNKSDVMNIDQNQISHFSGIQTFDVIPVNGVLIMIGSDGLYQYDYSDPTNIVQLSHIAIQ